MNRTTTVSGADRGGSGRDAVADVGGADRYRAGASEGGGMVPS
jgi:hypothetical protein